MSLIASLIILLGLIIVLAIIGTKNGSLSSNLLSTFQQIDSTSGHTIDDKIKKDIDEINDNDIISDETSFCLCGFQQCNTACEEMCGCF